MTKPYADLQSVLNEFAKRFIGTRRDWFQALEAYKQIHHIKKCKSCSQNIYQDFIRIHGHIDTQARK